MLSSWFTFQLYWFTSTTLLRCVYDVILCCSPAALCSEGRQRWHLLIQWRTQRVVRTFHMYKLLLGFLLLFPVIQTVFELFIMTFRDGGKSWLFDRWFSPWSSFNVGMVLTQIRSSNIHVLCGCNTQQEPWWDHVNGVSLKDTNSNNISKFTLQGRLKTNLLNLLTQPLGYSDCSWRDLNKYSWWVAFRATCGIEQ